MRSPTVFLSSFILEVPSQLSERLVAPQYYDRFSIFKPPLTPVNWANSIHSSLLCMPYSLSTAPIPSRVTQKR